MKRSFFLLVIVLLFNGGTAWAVEHIAVVKNISGDVHVVRCKNTLNAAPGMHLMNGDRLILAHNSYTGIIFTDGTIMTFGPETDIRIDKYMFEPEKREYAFSMYMQKGAAVYSSGKMGKLSPESVEINTPKATLGVRGTRFIVQVD